MIDDIAKLRLAHRLLALLSGIVHQIGLVKQVEMSESDLGQQPLESIYSMMDCQLRHLPANDQMSQAAESIRQAMTTHGPTHEQTRFAVRSIFEIQKEGLFQAIYPFRKLHRRMLWLGAPASNVVEALSKGLTILKTESASSVGFFGKALYFTDVVSKAAKHCGLEQPGKNGYLLLCEVATGNEYPADRSKVYSKPPKGFHSVKGQGKYESTHYTDIGGAKASVGIPQKVEASADSSFLYNEFAVFDEQQVRPCYLVRIEFL